MTNATIKTWIAYWTAAKMVAFEQINSAADLREARRFCACMRKGVFSNVTDAAIWTAIQSMRAERPAA